MYKLVFYIPENYLEPVKDAVFATGTGRIGDYDACCWQVLGQGQFRPLQGSNPFLGKQGALESVAEYRVELVCEDVVIHKAIKALRQSHPYEQPAFDVWRLEDI